MDFLNRNIKEFLKELQSEKTIVFQEWNLPHCNVYQINDFAEISYNSKSVNSDSVVHELLHIWVRKYVTSTSSCLFNTVKGTDIEKYFPKYHCDQVGNFLEHHLFYPKYLELGCKSENFVLNGNKKKVKLLKLGLWSSLFSVKNPVFVQFFIGNYLAMKFDHAKNNYCIEYWMLKRKCKSLFSICEKFSNKWTNLKVEDIDGIFICEKNILWEFQDEIKEWAKK